MDLRSLQKTEFFHDSKNAAENQTKLRYDITSFSDDLTFTIPASKREVIKKFMEEQDEKVKLMVLNKIGKTTGCEVQNGLVKYGPSGEGYDYIFSPSTLCMNLTKIRNCITGEELDLTVYENEDEEPSEIKASNTTSQETDTLDELLRKLQTDTKTSCCPCENTSGLSALTPLLTSLIGMANTSLNSRSQNTLLDTSNTDTTPNIPLPTLCKGTLTSTMYGAPVKCDVYCRGLMAISAKLLIVYTGSYRNGEKVVVNISSSHNNSWRGTTLYSQQIIIYPKKLENDNIVGEYSTSLPSDKGTFVLSKVESDADFPIFEDTLKQGCIIS